MRKAEKDSERLFFIAKKILRILPEGNEWIPILSAPSPEIWRFGPLPSIRRPSSSGA
jgi:hypothetical protein